MIALNCTADARHRLYDLGTNTSEFRDYTGGALKAIEADYLKKVKQWLYERICSV